MRLAKLRLPTGGPAVGVVEKDEVRILDLRGRSDINSLSDILAAKDAQAVVTELLAGSPSSVPLKDATLLAPIDQQEVWAAGVTYQRSQQARREESKGGGSFYDLVYTADRPELFFKATPHRVVGPGGTVRVRSDSHWSVPEPELTLVLSPLGELVGFTIGNDMSARDIEGANPLYLPQAKVYCESCALGPVITLRSAMPAPNDTAVTMSIRRGGATVFEGSTSLTSLRRTYSELIDWLTRENRFPQGVFLMTGTGIVPPDEFTLKNGDEISISITGIGTLTNRVLHA